MKKRIISVLALVLVLTFLLSGCELGTIQQGVRPSNGSTVPPVTAGDGNVDENPFTVQLMYNGKPFRPGSPITIQWSNESEVHIADATSDSDGLAAVGGLDGDYRVTLLNIPDGYAYNPNVHTANNKDRNIEIELYDVIKPRGKGLNLYEAISITQTGVYYLEISGPDEELFFEFAPKESGTYGVESWMDVTANNVNPLCNYYGAGVAAKYFQYLQDGGGAESTYTKNFFLTVEIADENISKTGSGSAVFTFGVFADQKNGWPVDKRGEYIPLKLYIAITLDGEFGLDHASGTIVAPEEDLDLIKQLVIEKNGPDALNPSAAWHWAEDQAENSSLYIFDSENYRYWAIEDGGDGVYHRYDPVKYADNGGYGPVLFARISEPGRFLTDRSGKPIALSEVEYEGNKLLTVDDGELNYKMFIEGWEKLNYTDYDKPGDEDGKYPPYFCDLLCPCRQSGTCTSAQLGYENGTCETGCPNCASTCRNLPRELIGTVGYAQMCNANGDFPVTKEMAEFLQKLSISQLYFMDGQGWVETNTGIYATEADQWLWDCGYYE